MDEGDKIRRKALARGATVEIGGKAFNPSGAMVNTHTFATKRSEPIPTPEVAVPVPAPVLPVAQPAPIMVNVDTTAIAAAVKSALEARPVPEQAPVSSPTLDPVRKWKFTVRRDGRGLIETIHAEAE